MTKADTSMLSTKHGSEEEGEKETKGQQPQRDVSLLDFMNERPNFLSRIDFVSGSVTNEADVVCAATGCDAIYHLAGCNQMSTASAEEMDDLHINGTINVIRAAAHTKLKRIVVCSAAGVVSPLISATDNPAIDGDGCGPCEEAVENMPFYYSKAKAEKIIVATANEVAVKVVILRPSWMLGPNMNMLADEGPEVMNSRESMSMSMYLSPAASSTASKSSSAALLGQLMHKGSVQHSTVHGGFSIVDVRDVAIAFLNAMQV